MNRLIWKLLKKHISIGQLTGYALASFIGLTIILVSLQSFCDISPLLTEGEHLFKKEYLVINKKVSMLKSVFGANDGFSKAEMKELKEQPFVKSIGEFTSSQFDVVAGVGIPQGMNVSTALFFESVPTQYIDVQTDKWKYQDGSHDIPIIIPRNYLNLYNFGFSESRGLPKISEGLMKMIGMNITVRGNGLTGEYHGNIVGFSSRLNTILVPESFMKRANAEYGNGKENAPSRLIVEVTNPSDPAVGSYLKSHGYETEQEKLDDGKAMKFLQAATMTVGGIGAVISILSLYILMLSIFLLVQKNSEKLENLLIIGYHRRQVALPYQLLTVGISALVSILSIGAVSIIRKIYLSQLSHLFPDYAVSGTLWPTIAAAVVLLLLISLMNIWVIKNKIRKISC